MRKFNLAITVDDLPIHGPLAHGIDRFKILDGFIKTFKKYNLAEIYGFCNGKQASADTLITLKILKMWAAEGHLLANHTFSHLDIRNVEPELFLADVFENETFLNLLSPDKYIKAFRYPYLLEGETEKKRNYIRKHLIESGYRVVSCSVDFFDYAWNDAISMCIDNNDEYNFKELKKAYFSFAVYRLKFALELTKHVFKREINHILLLHLGISTSFFLEELLYEYEKIGCSFISVKEALQDPIYSMDSKFVSMRGCNIIAQYFGLNNMKRILFPDPPITLDILKNITQKISNKST